MKPATSSIRRKAASWSKFEARPGDTFEVNYDRTETFVVICGRAEIFFDSGVSLEIRSNDHVTIHRKIGGAGRSWSLSRYTTNTHDHSAVKEA
ncbi:cupin domain-containing protein [Rhizobium mongolense]|uniref:cupin domain-containing protein n=1 Tax=Rhizobium mongolense TaxID=57676 RepID=UPI0034A18D9B